MLNNNKSCVYQAYKSTSLAVAVATSALFSMIRKMKRFKNYKLECSLFLKFIARAYVQRAKQKLPYHPHGIFIWQTKRIYADSRIWYLKKLYIFVSLFLSVHALENFLVWIKSSSIIFSFPPLNRLNHFEWMQPRHPFSHRTKTLWKELSFIKFIVSIMEIPPSVNTQNETHAKFAFFTYISISNWFHDNHQIPYKLLFLFVSLVFSTSWAIQRDFHISPVNHNKLSERKKQHLNSVWSGIYVCLKWEISHAYAIKSLLKKCAIFLMKRWGDCC